MAKMTGKRWPIVGHRMHNEFPYLECEVSGISRSLQSELDPFQVRYAIREYAQSAVDVIARRLRLAFLNTYAAHEVLPRVR